jgi:hypothetical protein
MYTSSRRAQLLLLLGVVLLCILPPQPHPDKANAIAQDPIQIQYGEAQPLPCLPRPCQRFIHIIDSRHTCTRRETDVIIKQPIRIITIEANKVCNTYTFQQVLESAQTLLVNPLTPQKPRKKKNHDPLRVLLFCRETSP